VDGDAGQFDMTAFSLRETHGANAVSKLHAETANETWSGITRQPILAITNGVHPPSGLGGPAQQLYHQLGADLDNLDDGNREKRFWDRLDRIPDAQLWEAHRRQKLELAIFARRRLQSQFARHGEAPGVLARLADALDPNVLTIGFARRFATYKRAALLFSDEERLAAILSNKDRPVQIVFAGKAHPADRPGQRVIQDIFSRSRAEALAGHVYVLEDYNIRAGRYLVQGTDVWLNNPRRPLEASGTSGMKAAMNGIINCSVLDGWWDEGYNGRNGWAIGDRETVEDEGAQDWADAQDLYRLFEEEIVPAYYDRGKDGLPKRWLQLMRDSVASAIWQFSTTRMLEEYVDQLYVPAALEGAQGAKKPVAAAAGPTSRSDAS
jgi:starch phosphorylase